jgi:hypothetical protein
MRIREYTEADLGALVAMHRSQGFDYPLPDIRDPIFVSKLVLEAEDCDATEKDGEKGEGNRVPKIVMAALARLTCEMYLLADPHCGSPRDRYARLLGLHRAGAADLRSRGLDDAHAWLPPPIAKRFGRRLEALGWIRDDAWTPYCFRLR